MRLKVEVAAEAAQRFVESEPTVVHSIGRAFSPRFALVQIPRASPWAGIARAFSARRLPNPSITAERIGPKISLSALGFDNPTISRAEGPSHISLGRKAQVPFEFANKGCKPAP